MRYCRADAGRPVGDSAVFVIDLLEPGVLGVCLTTALLIVFFTVAVSLNSRPGRAPSCGLAGAAR